MNEKRCSNNQEHRREPEDTDNSPASLKKPPFYNCVYWIIVGLCVAGIAWLFRSGALVLWDRHPGPGDNYEFGWFITLLFAVPGGFLVGSYLMFQLLIWYQGWAFRNNTKKK